MSGKGKRRSARLLRLEEQQKNDGSGGGGGGRGLLDPWQIIRNSISGATARGKRKRNDVVIQKLQGEASCSQAIDAAYMNNVLSSQSSSTGRIIEYILDTLELRDTHELFAMPDDIQVSDYAERVSRPGDFATLRQKNTDGMYKTLQQFENDVYMVFQKAISINSQDTIPYREAMSLLDQARQVFLSLKSNQMYSEPEIMAWRQKQLDVGTGKAVREDDEEEEEGSDGGPSDADAPPRAARTEQLPSPQARKKVAAAEKRQQTAGYAGNFSADNSRARPREAREGGKSTPGRKARKVAATVGAGAAGVERRRLTYTDEVSEGRAATTAAATILAFRNLHEAKRSAIVQHSQLQGHTYLDSMRRFVRHAGLKARVAAEFRSLECDARARQNPTAPAYWNGFTPGAGTGTGGGNCFLPYGSYCPPSPPSAAEPSSHAVGEQQAPPVCKLESDELLRLVMLMGTPAFLERAKQVFRDAPCEGSSKEGHVTTINGDDARVCGAAAGAPEQKINASKPAAPEHKSGSSKPASTEQKIAASKPAVEFGPFAPPKLIPGRLGFVQFASSSARPFKEKPPTMLKPPGKKNRE